MNLKELSNQDLLSLKKKLEYDIANCGNAEYAYKIFLNSCYGYLGCNYSRFYDKRLAEAVTLSGQLVIKWVANRVNKFLNKLLKNPNEINYLAMLDTDSNYFILEDVVKKYCPDKSKTEIAKFLQKFCNEILQKQINEAFDDYCRTFNTFDQTLSMKLESISDKILIQAKKHYVANIFVDESGILNEPKLKIMGIEAIKSSTPEHCRKLIKKAINIIMNESEKDIQKYILELKNDFKNLPIVDISFPRSVTDLKKYTDKDDLYRLGTPINVRASLIYNQLIKNKDLVSKYDLIKDGDKIRFLYLKTPNPIGSDVIGYSSVLPEEFNLVKYIDYDTQFEKILLKPIQSLLDVIGYSSTKENNGFDCFDFEE